MNLPRHLTYACPREALSDDFPPFNDNVHSTRTHDHNKLESLVPRAITELIIYHFASSKNKAEKVKKEKYIKE